MMRMKVGIAAMTLAMMGWFCSSAVAAEVEIKELNFGIISTESTANLKEGFDPFVKALEKKLGMKVNAFFAPDYAGVI